MALVSSKVAAGVQVLADQFNKLWTDLVANHNHSAGQGGTVDHKDLAETGTMAGMHHTHGNIETHLVGDGNSFNDAHGGDRGVHGLAAAARVFGIVGHASQTQGGTTVLTQAQMVAVVGQFVPTDADATVDFGLTFDDASQVYVLGQYVSDAGNVMDQGWRVTNVTKSSFDVSFGDGATPVAFNWMAIGPKVS
jgi:hypothetical protein